MARIDVAKHQLTIPENGGEQVVEIVRNAAGQPSDRFHFLRLLKLRFERVTLGDVDANTHGAHGFAVRSEVDAARAVQPSYRTVGPERSAPNREIASCLHGALHRLEHRLSIVGMDVPDTRLGRPLRPLDGAHQRVDVALVVVDVERRARRWPRRRAAASAAAHSDDRRGCTRLPRSRIVARSCGWMSATVKLTTPLRSAGGGP